MSDEMKFWYYLRYGQAHGPLDVETLIRDGHKSLVWHPGLAGWRPSSELMECVGPDHRLPRGVNPAHIPPPPPPSDDPTLTWTQLPSTVATGPQDPSVLLARAGRVEKAFASWPEALFLFRADLLRQERPSAQPRNFLGCCAFACQLLIVPGAVAATHIGLKRSIGLLYFPFIGTIGIPTGGHKGGGLLFQSACNGGRYAIVNAADPSFTFLAIETSDAYIGITSLDFRAFEQPSENRKPIKQAERAYAAIGLTPRTERMQLVFTERTYNHAFSMWAARILANY